MTHNFYRPVTGRWSDVVNKSAAWVAIALRWSDECRRRIDPRYRFKTQSPIHTVSKRQISNARYAGRNVLRLRVLWNRIDDEMDFSRIVHYVASGIVTDCNEGRSERGADVYSPPPARKSEKDTSQAVPTHLPNRFLDHQVGESPPPKIGYRPA